MEHNLDDLGKLSDLKDKGIITEEEFRKKKEQLLKLSSNQKDEPQQSEEKTVKGEKWHQKPLGIIVLLFLFFPVGLYLMWKHSNWSKQAKWTITGVFAVAVFLMLIIPQSPPTEQETVSKVEPKKEATISAKEKAANEAEEEKKAAEAKAKQEAEDKAKNVPAEYKSALAQATTYANDLNLSKKGVYDQLVSEYGGQFKAEAAQYAIDNVKADWNASALAQAKTYQNDLHLSPSAIRDQLVSEYGGQFTASEADYAIQHLND